MSDKNCVYCGKEITVPSEEHVIQNALGGRLKSTKICCGKCNNDQVSHILDKPFIDIFTPITSNIPLFAKQKNSDAVVPYQAIAEFDGTKYDVTVKGESIACPELAKKLRCDVSKLPGWKILYHKFNVDNDAFHNGISKIAVNYALACDISPDFLRHGIHTETTNGTVSKIVFSFPTVPYAPLNPVDTAIDITPIRNMTHNLILFSLHNQLWCYVDLFNTFQHYVLLSENFKSETPVYKTYSQCLQRTDASFIDDMLPPDGDIHSAYKDIALIASQYGVKPTFDIAELKKQIESKSRARTLDNVIESQVNENIDIFDMRRNMSATEFDWLIKTFMLYFHESDEYDSETTAPENKFLRPGGYRVLTFDSVGNLHSYPALLNDLYHESPDMIRKYTNAKFSLLNYYLLQNKKHSKI